MADLTEKDIKEIRGSLDEILETTENKEMFEAIAGLLAMPDDKFMILAPGVMQQYQQSLNNPSDKIALAQAFNAAGIKAEDLTQAFTNLDEEIDKLNLSNMKREFLKGLLLSIVNAVNDTEGIAKKTIKIPVEALSKDVRLPEYAHISDSGMDVFALEDVVIHPGETVLVHTGIKVALPAGYEFQVRPKSGRALNTKMRVANAPGTIDQEYRDEIGIIIDNIEPRIKDITTEPVFDEEGNIKYFNVTSIEYGKDMIIGKGEKFCQLVLAEVIKAAWEPVGSIMGIGEDRGGGFGSSGLK